MSKSVDLSGDAFADVDGSGFAGDFISYLDQATNLFRSVKLFTHSLLRLRPGDKILDVGCGCGDDVRELAALVAPNGSAVGIDSSQSMIDEARLRNAGREVQPGFDVCNAERLSWHSDYFDACRADRVFQHLSDPERVLSEMLRVVRPDGRVLVVDRDWGMVAIDSPDGETTRAVLSRACGGIRNGWIGRKLYGLFKNVGVIDPDVHTKSISIRGLELADTLLDLRVVLNHAIAERLVAQDIAAKWLNDLQERDAAGNFFATITVYIAYGRK